MLWYDLVAVCCFSLVARVPLQSIFYYVKYMTKTTEEDRLEEYEKLLEEFLTSDGEKAIQVGGALPEGLPASARPFPPRILEEGMKLKVPQDLSEFYTMESSLFSSLLPRFYAQVKFIFASMLPPATVKNIIDATGNVGGDVILFRDLYENANIDTIELDKDTFLCLKHNSKDTTLSKVLGRELHNGRVTAHHDNCITYLRRPDIKADVVYFDPPWGGPDYHKEKNLVLTLDEPLEKRKDPVAYTIYPDRMTKAEDRSRTLSVAALIGESIANVAPLAVYKAPVNIDLDELKSSATKELASRKPGAKPLSITTFNVNKPYTNVKGKVAYHLHFIREEF